MPKEIFLADYSIIHTNLTVKKSIMGPSLTGPVVNENLKEKHVYVANENVTNTTLMAPKSG